MDYEIKFGKVRPAPAYGKAGNSAFSDWEFPAVVTFSDGSSVADVFATESGARWNAARWSADQGEREHHSGFRPAGGAQ